MPTASMAVARAARPSDAGLLAAGAPNQQERILPVQWPLGPSPDLLVQLLSQARDRLPFRELPPAQLGGDVLDPTSAYPLHHHLHQRQHECLGRTRPSRSLVTLKQNRQRRYLPDRGASPVRSCRPALSADARNSRSGSHVTPRSAHQAQPRGGQSSQLGESGSLIGSNKATMPRSSWSNCWIFSPSISISKGALWFCLGWLEH